MGIRAQGNPIASFADLWSQTGTDAIPSPGKAPAGASGSPEGHEASGGIINDWLDPSPGKVYRTHIFINTGTFDVTALSGTYPANIEYLVVGGGGGGGMTRNGYTGGGGGGAGGFRTNLSGHPLEAPAYTIGTGVYNVVVGGGGNSGKGGAPQWDPGGPSNSQAAQNGGNSEFYPAPISYPNTSFIRGAGGGGGGNAADPSAPAGQPGGSGGGTTYYNPDPAGGTVITDPNHPLVAGYAGGAQAPTSSGGSISGGGGGAGGVGEDGRGTTAGPDSPTTSPYGAGGPGVQAAFAGPPTASPIGVPGPSGNGWFAGGGGGGLYSAPTPEVPTYSPWPAGNGGAGGGGTGVTAGPGVFPAGGVAGTRSTGSGGGGGGTAGGAPDPSNGGQGGSGIVAIRYQIGTVAPGAKATGGDISYNATTEKWIHTFTTSGTFATGPTWAATDVSYFIVGGGASGAGAGGGSYGGGGGGAGAVRVGTTPIAAHPVSTTIQVGAGGAASYHELLAIYTGINGTPSYFGAPIAATGGGGGGQSAGDGVAGGSGGGAGGTGTSETGGTGSGDPYPGSPPDESPTNGWGNDGGDTPGAMNGGAGGGGASSVGSNGQPKGGGSGGSGIAIPTTFYSPTISVIGGNAPPTNPGEYWVAGGGGGSTYLPDSEGGGGGGGRAAATADEAGYAGGGQGEGSYNWPFAPDWTGRPLAVSQGWENTGGGGGGGGTGSWGYKGGSGLVIIAYPA